MKTQIIISLLAILFTTPLFAQDLTRKEKKELRKQEKLEMVESLFKDQQFLFIADKAMPNRGRNIDLSGNNYTLEIYADSAVAYLPFFGEAFNIAYGGGDGGIKFEEKIDEIDWKANDKKKLVTFEVNTNNDYFNGTLNITESGYATLTISSQNRSTISYYGTVEKYSAEK